MATPLAGHLESVALGWLKELFGLPPSWGGILTTGATMANFTALACARRWWGLRQGVDVDVRRASAACRRCRSSARGYVHPSDTKALAMLGLGRDAVRKLTADGVGRLDLAALERELEALGGAPAVVIASAGEVNAGDFDPTRLRWPTSRSATARGCTSTGRSVCSPPLVGSFAPSRGGRGTRGLGDRRRPQVAERPLRLRLRVREGRGAAGARSSRSGAAYLPDPLGPKPTWGFLGPEMSRRARAFTVWATLRAYGRERLPGDRRAAPRPGAAPRPAGRRGAGPRTAGGRASEHRVLPLPPERHRGRIAWTS